MTYAKKWEGVYEGQWKNDKKHGRGVLIRYDERIEDEQENDKRVSYDNGGFNFEIKAGKFLDAYGNVKNQIDKNGNIYDAYGRYYGKINKDGYIFDENGRDNGRIDRDGFLYDHYGKPNGKVDSAGKVEDSNGNLVGKFVET